ncbi:lipopolysaccharide transport system permease protein [Pustulibacterium marinum]|uniref:Transport permease protein n=1 Tax=Pustulibacterium marinum TaxID=1224947 RepID=A0A1I7HMN1_9FLAO|nr:lipopolysaccharide transport system permease protein [Pustulibacterium marinum]
MEEQKWLYEISPKKGLLEFNFKEIWRYRDLLFLFVKRDIVTVYKQTILGPLWYLIQPLFTSIIYTLIFNSVAGIKTGAVPAFLFNLAGVSLWNYYKECLTATSTTFTTNQNLFSKVYFPRVVMPLSTVISNLLKYGIQLLIFIVFYLYFVFAEDYLVAINSNMIYFPILIVEMALLGLGLGMILSSMTTKYRDVSFLVTFGVQLLMYVSAVMYPIAEISKKVPEYAWLVTYNPLALIIESFRNMVFGTTIANFDGIWYSLVISIVTFLAGLAIFNRTEKNFIDTV